MNIAFFPGCMVEMLYPEVGIAAVHVLERLGCSIDMPDEQICCGQGLLNSGYKRENIAAAKNMIDAFEREGYDTIVSLSGSCMNAIINDYPIVFADDPEYLERTRALRGRFFEFTDFIVNRLGVTNVGASLHDSLTYHKSCHVTRLLGIKEAPLQLLDEVKGLEYREMKHADRCCGFGGTFSFKEPEISKEMVSEKAQTVLDTGANILCGSDIACLMNIKGRLARMKEEGLTDRDIRVMHIAQVLDSRE